MKGKHLFNGIYFDEQAIIDPQVEPKSLLTPKLLVPNHNLVLILDLMTSQ